jgi:hypothetical protein
MRGGFRVFLLPPVAAAPHLAKLAKSAYLSLSMVQAVDSPMSPGSSELVG